MHEVTLANELHLLHPVLVNFDNATILTGWDSVGVVGFCVHGLE
jgi:hypothetical protein